jgi:tetratricopeptide (TPR) repeat protein
VLVPPRAMPGEIDAELAIEGLSALLVARLRALPEVRVVVDAAGCARAERPTHAIEIARELTETSALTSIDLRHCASQERATEQWVQPRQARRDWSAEAAWWVGGQLQVPRPALRFGGAVDEADMQGFLVALARLKRRTAADVSGARDTLLQLTRKTPDFALAQAHLAAADLLAFEYGLLPLPEALELADKAIEAALQVDPDLGMAHAARGLYWMNQERYDEAVPQLARAAALDPGEAVILLWLGNALLYHGRPREAQPWLERAHALDTGLVSAQISLGEAACFAAVEADCAQFLRQPGSGPMASFMAALIHAHQGDYRRALALLSAVPDDVNENWVLDLRKDLCALQDGLCPAVLVADGLPRWADTDADSALLLSPLGPNLDLWRIDLGLAPWMRAAGDSVDAREQLRAEVRRLQSAGLKLDLLDEISLCLDQWQQGTAAIAPSVRGKLLQAWGCAVEPST